MKKFTDKLPKKSRVAEILTSTIANAAAHGTALMIDIVRGCSQSEEFLPKTIPPITNACFVLERFDDVAANKVTKGKSPGGVLELTTLLSDVNDVKKAAPLVLQRSQFQGQYEAILEEWSTAFASHCAKYEDLSDVVAFTKEFKDVEEAAVAWDFSSCPRIYKNSSPDEEQMAKRIEAIVTQFSTWKIVTERLQKQMGWAEAKFADKAKSLLDAIPAKKKIIDDVAMLMATTMLATVMVKSVDEKDEASNDKSKSSQIQQCLKYVTQVLKVEVDSLPTALQGRLRDAAGSRPSGSEAVGSVGGPTTAAGRRLRKKSVPP